MSASGLGHVWPQGYTLNNLGRGEAMYKISKARAFWFQIRRFSLFEGFLYVKHAGPEAGPFFVPREIT